MITAIGNLPLMHSSFPDALEHFTGEIVRQIPPEELLAIARTLRFADVLLLSRLRWRLGGRLALCE